MIVVDVETTGLDPKKNSLLSIGAVNFLNPSQTFYGECKVWDGAEIEDQALTVNGFTRDQVTDQDKISEAELIKGFMDWVEAEDGKIFAGENVFFDHNFIKEACGRAGISFSFGMRTVDLHAVSYADHMKKGIEIPEKNGKPKLSLDETLKYVGLPPEPKPHIAINGAKLEAEAFSRIIYGKGLFEEYKNYPLPR